MAPVLPPAAMMLKSLVPCSGRKISAIKLQKTETTNKLNTDSQTKKTRAIHCGATWLDIIRKNPTRWLAKNAYTVSSNRSARRADVTESGVATSVVANVAVIILEDAVPLPRSPFHRARDEGCSSRTAAKNTERTSRRPDFFDVRR
jgi:hypothetical protein